jgi:hypothetical protein
MQKFVGLLVACSFLMALVAPTVVRAEQSVLVKQAVTVPEGVTAMVVEVPVEVIDRRPMPEERPFYKDGAFWWIAGGATALAGGIIAAVVLTRNNAGDTEVSNPAFR